MELALQNSLIRQKDTITRRRGIGFDIGMCLLYTVLIMAGVLFTKYATILAFLIAVLVFYVIPLENTICQFLYLMAFATVFKMSPSATSLITILQLYLALLIIIKRPYFRPAELLMISLMAISILAGVLINSNLKTLYVIKFIAALFLCIGFKNTNYQKELSNYIILFVLGLVVSSTIAYFGGDVSQINSYIVVDQLVEESIEGFYFSDTSRFSGLNADANYYCINLFIGIMGNLVLYNKGAIKSKLYVYISSMALFFFGIQTVSKSFGIMAIVVCLYLLILAIKNGKKGILFSMLLLIGIVLYFVINRRIGAINNLVDRIINDFNSGDLTTGRTELWKNYFSFLFSRTILIPFGSGLSNTAGGLSAAHNTYVEMIVMLGFIGTIIFMGFLLVYFYTGRKHFKRSIENYSILVVIMLMYFFLSMLTWVDLPVHLFICYCFLNYDIQEKNFNFYGK